MAFSRTSHRRLAGWMVVLLLVTALTGVAYRIGRTWFGISRDFGDKILDIHAGDWLGKYGSPAYVVIIGGSLLFLLITGAMMAWKMRHAPPKPGTRWRHRLAALIFLLPLFLSASTGILYKLGDDLLGFSDPALSILMKIHQGSWLGKPFSPFYVIFVAGGLIWLAITGLGMLGWFKASGQKARPTSQG